ncbi:MAG: hypothetical protein IPJ95_10505 [Gemmatimonadetes bacterium]|nr:hypothetical protein [Gemmatimonadota bacterium]MBK7783097.1 hypothetical protein [Gemmatimonadota bacterium]MBK7924043.1 hypothetical protein [Gemmatimonadota bacterium]MBP6669829.1 hypothetical protein [Gemmatimonadales bacterium]MBP9198976.1 hypothetical protein [Gemmatimonadales bacterium]
MPAGGALTRLAGLIGATVGGSVGWWLGARQGVMTGFVLGVVGTAVCGYWARRWADSALR